MWTVSAIQMHPKGLIVCDEDATLELHVKVNIYLNITTEKVINLFISIFVDCQIFQIN